MLDELFSPRIGQLLSDSGIDCICVADHRMLCTQNDATILTAAHLYRRRTFTRDATTCGAILWFRGTNR